MAADFSGYATKNGLKCSDGRTILANAFKDNDGGTVPLVWQHQHNEPTNILGHAVLENRSDGVYTYGYFNTTSGGENAKTLVKHKDITALSIYASKLVQRGDSVLHGDIKEVSLVLSGANPGAFIDNVNLMHGDVIETLDDEAVIYTGLPLEHQDRPDLNEELSTLEEIPVLEDIAIPEDQLVHAENGKTVKDVFDELDEEQKKVVYFMIGQALEDAEHGDDVQHEDQSDDQFEHAQGAPVATQTGGSEKTVKDVFDTLTEEQKTVVYFMIGEALEAADEEGGTAKQGDDEGESFQHSEDYEQDIINTFKEAYKEGSNMTRNVFEQNGPTDASKPTLSHSQIQTIVEDAQKTGSFKESFLAHAVEYGIEDIDFLFPDAKSANGNIPDVIGRRQEWVSDVINGTKHSPFSRIKSTAVDLTADEARAKGYVKGALKKDEIIKLLKRVTTPTTIYKKQKLDRDDIVDITDLDVVAWLKAEMRLMLDEELARAVLIGDGREPDDEDKIDEDHLRPIAFDVDMYAHQITVQSNMEAAELIESVLRARTYYKGTGLPTLYTTDSLLTDLLLLKDKVNRRLYETEAALAAAMRVSKIVTVEVMESVPDVLAVIVNLTDYTLGADKGGNISMFDDFDIDYNQYKYLIETRVSGALTKPKSAVVIKRTAGTLVTPTSPSYNGATHTITFPVIAGVDYKVDGSIVTGTLVIDETTDVESSPATGYSFPHNINTDWTFVYSA